jgi:hypothetical protein
MAIKNVFINPLKNAVAAAKLDWTSDLQSKLEISLNDYGPTDVSHLADMTEADWKVGGLTTGQARALAKALQPTSSQATPALTADVVATGMQMGLHSYTDATLPVQQWKMQRLLEACRNGEEIAFAELLNRASQFNFLVVEAADYDIDDVYSIANVDIAASVVLWGEIEQTRQNHKTLGSQGTVRVTPRQIQEVTKTTWRDPENRLIDSSSEFQSFNLSQLQYAHWLKSRGKDQLDVLEEAKLHEQSKYWNTYQNAIRDKSVLRRINRAIIVTVDAGQSFAAQTQTEPSVKTFVFDNVSSPLLRIKIDEAKKDYHLLLEQYITTAESLRNELNPGNRVRLQYALDSITGKIAESEAILARLEAESKK